MSESIVFSKRTLSSPQLSKAFGSGSPVGSMLIFCKVLLDYKDTHGFVYWNPSSEEDKLALESFKTSGVLIPIEGLEGLYYYSFFFVDSRNEGFIDRSFHYDKYAKGLYIGEDFIVSKDNTRGEPLNDYLSRFDSMFIKGKRKREYKKESVCVRVSVCVGVSVPKESLSSNSLVNPTGEFPGWCGVYLKGKDEKTEEGRKRDLYYALLKDDSITKEEALKRLKFIYPTMDQKTFLNGWVGGTNGEKDLSGTQNKDDDVPF
jgi:hypothetical protein